MRFPRETERFGMAALLLNKIQTNPDDLSPVLSLQSFLLRQVIIVERRINRLKKARGRIKVLKRNRPPRARSLCLKELASKTEERIHDLHHLIFLWKCFGDGIACVYQSSYSLKHLYFDGDYEVKSDAGFISGKAGFIGEYRLLRKALASNVPAVLSDLTNVIRHGDVCLMGAADPVPLEVKSSTNINARVTRQIEQLKVLHDFFQADGAANFRGVPNTKRVAVSAPTVSYQEQINQCMNEALSDGMATVSPEPGLTYLCTQNDEPRIAPFLELLKQQQTPTTLVVALTPEPSWLPHKSFTASLSPANTVLFMQERFTCLVLIDLAIVKLLLDERELEPVIIMDGSTAMQIAPRINKENGRSESKSIAADWSDRVGVFRISEFHFLRTATQFESPRWFADGVAEQMESMRQESSMELKPGEPFLMEIPQDWLSCPDCLVSLLASETNGGET